VGARGALARRRRRLNEKAAANSRRAFDIETADPSLAAQDDLALSREVTYRTPSSRWQ
jgi:hypothetical protein